MSLAVLAVAVAAWAGCESVDPDECAAIIAARPAFSVIARESRRHKLDPVMCLAVAAAESGFRSDVVGTSGEIGFFQLKPGYGGPIPQGMKPEKVERPDVNARLGVRYLARMRDICGTDPHRYLSCYNGRPPGPSKYSRTVLKIYHLMKAGLPRR